MFESYLIVTNHYLCLFRTCEIQAGIETSPSLLSFWGGGGWVTLGRLGTPIFSLTVQESRPLPQHTREGLDVYNQMVVDLDDVDTEMKSSSFLEAEKSSTVTLVEASRYRLQAGGQQH